MNFGVDTVLPITHGDLRISKKCSLLRDEANWTQIPDQPLGSCVTLGRADNYASQLG